MGQEEVYLVTQVLLACFCAIPMNSDTPLKYRGIIDTSKPSVGVAFHPVSLSGRPSACVTHTILHPDYKVLLVANYGSELWEQFLNKIFANGYDVICSVLYHE